MPLLIGLLIAASVSGGTAFAAEGAVPGDTLYPIKTEVNENVRSAFAFNTEARAELNAWRAERRLDETQKLAARAELSDDVKARLEANFDAHAERFEARIAEIAETDPALAAELATKFEASLAAHSAILNETDATTTASARVRIKASIDNVLKLRDDATIHAFAEDETDATITFDPATAAKRMYSAAETALANTKSLYTKIQSELNAETQTRVEVEIEKNAELFSKGAQHYNAEEYGDAFVSFQGVVRALSHLSVFLRTEGAENSDGEASVRIIHPMEIMPLPSLIQIHRSSDGGGESDTDNSETNIETEDQGVESDTEVHVEVEI
jgi:hypothetical protein